MTGLVKALIWVARIDGLVALVLGIVLWTGSAGQLKLHILSGFVMTITLLLLGMMGFFARLQRTLPLATIAWAILLPYLGFAQLRLLPGSSHALIQIVHLIVGVGAIGIAEVVGARILRASGRGTSPE